MSKALAFRRPQALAILLVCAVALGCLVTFVVTRDEPASISTPAPAGPAVPPASNSPVPPPSKAGPTKSPTAKSSSASPTVYRGEPVRDLPKVVSPSRSQVVPYDPPSGQLTSVPAGAGGSAAQQYGFAQSVARSFRAAVPGSTVWVSMFGWDLDRADVGADTLTAAAEAHARG